MFMSRGGSPLTSSASLTPNSGVGYFNTSRVTVPSGWAEAEAAITRLADAPADDGLVIREIWLLRLRALLARADGDDTAYRDYRDRHRDMATTLGFDGHIAWAEATP